MKKVIVGVVVIVVAAAAFLFLTRETPRVEVERIADDATRTSTQSGELIGYVEPNGSYAYLGIPFAKPPVGDLRWRAPVSPESWEGDREALEIGSICPQIGSVLAGVPSESYGKPVGDEDCLYLNIWRPSDAKPGSLPVMFWIHGGGNTIGHGGSPTYWGANLAETHNVVVVSVNYRLGPIGWFTHPALRDEEGDGLDNSGNYGTLDLVRGLKWVRDNISGFGGSPGNVTIFGESAGGVNVLSMMASPLAEGLYHRAIVQSGGLFVSSIATAENYSDDTEEGHDFSSREVVNQVLIRDGRAQNRENAKEVQESMSRDEIASLLRSQSAAELLSVYQGSLGGMLDMPAVFGDGEVLSDIITAELFSDMKNYNVTPVILGTNRDEVKLFMMMGGDQTKTVFGIPYGLKDEEAYNRSARYGSDAWKARGVDSIAMNLINAQRRNVFAYRFDWDEQKSVFGFDLGTALGAAHGLEIAFVFGNFEGGGFGLDIYDKAGIPARDALSKSMMSYWAEFAYSGDPGRGRDGKEVEWKVWQNGADQERLLVLDTSRDRGIRMTSDLVTMDSIKEAFITDSSLSNEEKCERYGFMFPGEAADDSAIARLGCEG